MPTQVLLVEDSAVAREKVSAILVELDCQVHTAEDGVEGLKAAKQQAALLDLIVLDIQMPKADGITLLRYLKKIPELASTPVIMLTTQADKDTVRTALGHGAKDFLRKDATIAHITERLQSHVEAVRAQPQEDERGNSGNLEETIRGLLTGSREVGRGTGPYVLCHIPDAELQDFQEGREVRQFDFFRRLVGGLALLNARYPLAALGYRIASNATEITKLLKSQEPIPWLLLIGRRPEGLSLARMIGLAPDKSERKIEVLCDPVAELPADAQKSVVRMGADLVDISEFDGDGMISKIAGHLLPPERVTPSGARVRRLAAGGSEAAKEGQVVTLHYSSRLEDGTTIHDTFDDEQPPSAPMGDPSVPAAIWQAVADLGMGGKAIVELKSTEATEPSHFQVEVIEIA